MERFEGHWPVEKETTVLALLTGQTELSGQRIKRAMTAGAVWLTAGRHTRRVRRAKRELRPGQTVHLYYDEHILDASAPQPRLISDEGRYSVWLKPYGLLSQGSKWGDHCTLGRYAERHLRPERNALIVHRLDRAARGLMILAHEKAAAAALSALFRDRQVDKRYVALVHGEPALGPRARCLDAPVDGREACSEVLALEPSGASGRTLVHLRLHTGRKHQARLHLAGWGYPIVGDRAYGSDDRSTDLCLTAYELSFECPLGGGPRHYALGRDDWALDRTADRTVGASTSENDPMAGSPRRAAVGEPRRSAEREGNDGPA